MRHLTPEQLVDLADGTLAETLVPHLADCAACRARLSDLRETIGRAAAVEVPEPSPLFWDLFSARVRAAVAAEGQGASRAPARRIDWAVVRHVGLPLSLAAGAFALALAMSWHATRTTVAVPVPAIADSAIPSEAVEGTAILPPDDPALDLVADLGDGLGWEQIHDAGIVVHAGMMNRAVSQLTAGERTALGKLLKQELAGGGS